MREYFIIFLIVAGCAAVVILSLMQAAGIEVKMPFNNLEDAIKLLKEVSEIIKEDFKKAMDFWKRAYFKIKGIWDRIIWQRVKSVIQRISSFFKNQIIKRASTFKQELKKEFYELKQDFIHFFSKILKRRQNN